MNRQKQILFALLVILVLALVYAFWSSPEQERVVTSSGMDAVAENRRQAGSENRTVSTQTIQLDLLDFEKRKYGGYTRDIFNFRRPKPKKSQPVVEPKPVVQPVIPKPTPVIDTAAQIRQQLARFTFLGFLLKDNQRTVFLSKRDELFLVKKGDTFGDEGRFEVLDISPEKLKIKQQGASGLIEIELVEDEPLVPSFSQSEEVRTAVPPVVNRPSVLPGALSPQERRRQWFKPPQSPANRMN